MSERSNGRRGARGAVAISRGSRLVGAALALLVALLPTAPAAQAQASSRPASASGPDYDYVILGGTVVDGTGSPGYRADIALRGDQVVRVSREPLDPDTAREVVCVEGMVVAPGFIDVHAHVEALLTRPLAESVLRQGVTTVAYAPDGRMPWPLSESIAGLRKHGHTPNIVFFAGHNTIRAEVMGSADRPPTAGELDRMRAMVVRAMEEGAIGLSTGLRYVPGAYAETREIIELARAAARHGGIYASHVRDEGPGSIESVAELIRIGREAGLPAHLTHHKLMGHEQWGLSRVTLAMVDSARAEGLDVTIDQYPYTATATSTAVLFPAWSLAGGTDSLAARLQDSEQRRRIEEGMRRRIVTERGGGDLSRIQLSRVSFEPRWEGLSFADIAEERGREPTVDFAIELAIEIQQQGGAGGIWHVVDEEDLLRIMSHPWTMIASDGALGGFGAGHPHPRAYGTFPRVLSRYVRELGVLTLEEAIRKMTSLPAWRTGLSGRGRIAEGLAADITVFDPHRVEDRSTFEDPHRFALGIEHVWVNGTRVIRAASLTGERPGRVLERDPGASPPAVPESP